MVPFLCAIFLMIRDASTSNLLTSRDCVDCFTARSPCDRRASSATMRVHKCLSTPVFVDSTSVCTCFPESTFVRDMSLSDGRSSEVVCCGPPTAFPFAFRAPVYRGCPAWTHRCASESRMTLRQRANPLSSWVESCCSVMVVFVFVVVVEVVRSAFV